VVKRVVAEWKGEKAILILASLDLFVCVVWAAAKTEDPTNIGGQTKDRQRGRWVGAFSLMAWTEILTCEHF
jgi:hypothetical protein